MSSDFMSGSVNPSSRMTELRRAIASPEIRKNQAVRYCTFCYVYYRKQFADDFKKDPDKYKDLTQEFLIDFFIREKCGLETYLRIQEPGPFRAYLRTSLKHFWIDDDHRQNARRTHLIHVPVERIEREFKELLLDEHIGADDASDRADSIDTYNRVLERFTGYLRNLKGQTETDRGLNLRLFSHFGQPKVPYEELAREFFAKIEEKKAISRIKKTFHLRRETFKKLVAEEFAIEIPDDEPQSARRVVDWFFTQLALFPPNEV